MAFRCTGCPHNAVTPYPPLIMPSSFKRNGAPQMLHVTFFSIAVTKAISDVRPAPAAPPAASPLPPKSPSASPSKVAAGGPAAAWSRVARGDSQPKAEAKKADAGVTSGQLVLT